jgi:hypothetical protein
LPVKTRHTPANALLKYFFGSGPVPTCRLAEGKLKVCRVESLQAQLRMRLLGSGKTIDYTDSHKTKNKNETAIDRMLGLDRFLMKNWFSDVYLKPILTFVFQV